MILVMFFFIKDSLRNLASGPNYNDMNHNKLLSIMRNIKL